MNRIVVSKWRRFGLLVLVTCPGCGLEVGLDHDVEDDGRVTPSLNCTECAFREFVTLGGWPDGPVDE